VPSIVIDFNPLCASVVATNRNRSAQIAIVEGEWFNTVFIAIQKAYKPYITKLACIHHQIAVEYTKVISELAIVGDSVVRYFLYLLSSRR
jgi:hypothetical protein